MHDGDNGHGSHNPATAVRAARSSDGGWRVVVEVPASEAAADVLDALDFAADMLLVTVEDAAPGGPASGVGAQADPPGFLTLWEMPLSRAG